MKKNVLILPPMIGTCADALEKITENELKLLRISREDLIRCFAEGVVLMLGKNPRDVRPVAHENKDGKWQVSLHYSKVCRPRPACAPTLH
jgi:hypothetical protein